MDLVLFLGAGVSVPSGLPTAADVTKVLLTVDKDGRNAGQVKLLRMIYELYEAHMPKQGMYENGKSIYYSGPSFKSPAATYEDIYLICSEIGFWGDGRAESPLVFSFMKNLSAQMQNEGDLRSEDHKHFEIGQQGSMLCDYIEGRWAALLRKSYAKGFEAISELTLHANVRGISIFTLNHDNLVEQFLDSQGVSYSDGFGERDGDLRWPNTSVYESSSRKVDIYKLHVGVDWYRFWRNGRPEIGISCRDDVGDLRDSFGVKLSPIRDLPWFLTGKDKSAMYHYGIMNELFFRFSRKLLEARYIVMSGYSWGDFTINSFIQGWLDSSAHNRLLLLHADVGSLVNSSSTLSENYRGWHEKGQIRVISRWLSDVSAAEIIAQI